MSVTQIYTAQPGDVITAARWNNEFGNLYDNVLTTSSSIIAAGSAGRTLAARFSDYVCVKDFGALGNGTTDDSAALQAALDYVATNGGMLYMPQGTYKCDTGLLVSDAVYPFTFIGDGPAQSILQRGSINVVNLLEIRGSDNVRIEKMTINGKASVYSGGGQALVFRDCSDVYAGNLFITDYVSSAILDYQLDDSTAVHGDNTFENILVDGLGEAQLGIMSANAYRCRFINCKVKNIDTAGNPGYGIQFKNNCYDCVMINPQVLTARMGIVISHDDVSAVESTNNKVYGGYAYNCSLTGVNLARTTYAQVYDVKVDMNNQGNDACSIVEEASYCDVRISTVNVAAAKGGVKFDVDVVNNVARITSMANPISGVTNPAGLVQSGGTGNTVYLDSVLTPAVTEASALFTNNGDSTNTFQCDFLPLRELQTVATGIITVKHYKTRFIILDTEASNPTDDLDTINGGRAFQIITIVSANSGRDTTIKHNTGNILLTGAADFTLSNTADTITLMYSPSPAKWVEVGRGDNS